MYDVVRATLPRMYLDDAFEGTLLGLIGFGSLDRCCVLALLALTRLISRGTAKDEIAHAIKTSLQTSMADYGFSILNALVTVRVQSSPKCVHTWMINLVSSLTHHT